MFKQAKGVVKSILKALGIWRFIEKRHPEKIVDPRRFWKGEPFLSLEPNLPLFAELKKDVFGLTFQQETRNCVFVGPQERITLNLPQAGFQQVLYLSFASEAEPDIEQKVKVFLNQKQSAELQYLVKNKWHTVCLNVNPPSFSREAEKRGRTDPVRDSASNGVEVGDFTDQQNSVLEIINESQNKIAFAYPILKPKYKSQNPNQGQSQGIKNIIVLVLDSLMKEAIGEFTPNINRFFQDGLSYSNCFSQSEWTLPAVYSLFLSRYPLDHGICELKPDVLGLNPKKDKTFVEKLQNQGFLTSAYSTVKVFHPGFNNYLVGFDRFFYNPFPQPGTTHLAMCQKAIEHLQGYEQNKNFLFLHFFDTHEPWLYPSEAEEAMLSPFRITAPYKEYEFLKKGAGDTKAEPIFDEKGIEILKKRNQARLKAVDLSLQFLFDYLEKTGKIKETAIVLTSDHGYLYLAGKQPLLCNSRLNTALFLKYPEFQKNIIPPPPQSSPSCKEGEEKGEGGCLLKFRHNKVVIDDLIAQNLDLGPTLLKIAGIENVKLGDGLIMPPFSNDKRDYVISESIFGDLYKASVRDKEYVYHLTCSFVQKTRKIQPSQVKTQKLFLRANESNCDDLFLKLPDKVKSLHQVLESHWKRFNEIVQ